jgi:hypothetical protein
MATGLCADHVVRCDLGLLHSVGPVFERNEPVLVDRVGAARHVASDKDIVGDQAVEIEGATARVTGHAPHAGREARRLQPVGVADAAKGDDRYVSVDGVPIGQVGAAQPSAFIAFQPHNLYTAPQINAV